MTLIRNPPKTETFFITTYCLTKGILQVQAVLKTVGSGNSLYISNSHDQTRKIRVFCLLGKEAFRTLEEAQVAATGACDKRIASLRKRIAKLEALRVTGATVVLES
jgi:hypothetical protein